MASSNGTTDLLGGNLGQIDGAQSNVPTLKRREKNINQEYCIIITTLFYILKKLLKDEKIIKLRKTT